MPQVAQQIAADVVWAVVDLWWRSPLAQDGADPPHRGIQHGRQRLEVTVGARGDESVGDELMFGIGDVGEPGRGAGELHPGAPCELATGADGPAHGLSDLLERNLEHVVQHEGHPLAGREPPQHLQHRIADLVIEGDPIGRIGIAGSHVIDRSRLVGAFMPDAGRTHLVQAQPSGDHCEPTPNVIDLRHVRSGQP